MMRKADLLLFGLLFGEIALAGHSPRALYSNCAKDEVLAAVLAPGASIRVISSIDGDGGTCYRIEVAQPGGEGLTGAFFDGSHPAIVAYRRSVQAPAQPPPAAAAAVAPVAAGEAAPAKPPRLADLSGLNFHDGKRFDMAKLKSKLVVVHFWETADDRSVREDIEFLAYLRTQYGAKGFDVVGITAEDRVNKIKALIDEDDASWPLLRDTTDLAAQYGVEGKSEMFLLNRGRKILVSGPRADNFEQRIVRELGR